MTRDLQADLALCEAASPGPWRKECYDDGPGGEARVLDADSRTVCDNADYYPCAVNRRDMDFFVAARTGYPETIHRLIAAEDILQRLVFARFYGNDNVYDVAEDAREHLQKEGVI